jgi:hypothetical protein
MYYSWHDDGLMLLSVTWHEEASLRPSLRKIVMAGHQFVSPDWTKFSPTNAVNNNQYGETQYPSARDASTNAPAINLSARSTVIESLR